MVQDKDNAYSWPSASVDSTNHRSQTVFFILGRESMTAKAMGRRGPTVFIEQNPRVSGLVQVKPMLFEDQPFSIQGQKEIKEGLYFCFCL